jgi:cytochrome c peroxidase
MNSRHTNALTVVLISLSLAACGGNGSSTTARNQGTQDDTQYELSTGMNPHPVKLIRPQSAPLSAMAQLGKQIFFDKSLSGSGQQSCASCHSPQLAYGPPGDGSVMLGGPNMTAQGARAVPSLMYLDRDTAFSIGPDDPSAENVNLNQLAGQAQATSRSTKTANNTAAAAQNLVPQGGLFWDGRVDTLQQQANGPLFNPAEMDGGDAQTVTQKLMKASYAQSFIQLFGNGIFNDPEQTVSEALFAVARYQIEDPSFHPYSSKYDAWLEGKVKLDPAEIRGYILFNDQTKANCAACHLDQPTYDHHPPLFTDHQYEALGVPRNMAITANNNPNYDDLGICGPFRTDLKDQTQYCGMFLTPTLRNVATRHAFFHNGVYHSLKEVLDFYDYRDTNPEKIYPVSGSGTIEKYNDIPARYQMNVDIVDPPFDRHPGEQPAMSAQDMQDIIAFLKTLTDGYTTVETTPAAVQMH